MVTLTASESPQPVVPLTLRDVADLSISWRARLDDAEIRQAIQLAPGVSVWNPETAEYAIALPWRNRREVIQIADLAAIRNPEALVRGVAAAAAEFGADQTVIVEVDEKRPASFYGRCGFDHIEQVVTYRIDTRLAPIVERAEGIRFTAVHPFDELTLATLISIDHRAFPWIWWNSEAEFLHYAVSSGVELYLGFKGDSPVSYIGVTFADEWGHIDRIAVDPEFQGSGIGLQTLSATVESMRRRGVRTLGLSTQSTNQRSQQLYEQFGFVRTRDADYDLWGDTIHRTPGLDLYATGQSRSSLGR
jgi:ribosomal protein S18 acetylase RimI-like enzyme